MEGTGFVIVFSAAVDNQGDVRKKVDKFEKGTTKRKE